LLDHPIEKAPVSGLNNALSIKSDYAHEIEALRITIIVRLKIAIVAIDS